MGDTQVRRRVEVIDGYLDPARCRELLAELAQLRAGIELPLVLRADGKRPLHYRVADGAVVRDHLPGVTQLAAEVRPAVEAMAGEPVDPLSDGLAAVNVNVTPPGGAYRWHYDRNRYTAIVYLNAVGGGEVEVYPGLRIAVGRRHAGLQRALDRVARTWPVRAAFGRRRVIAPMPGALLLMRGDRCLHSVRPVTGEDDRVCVVISFDRPGSRFPHDAALDAYLYTAEATPTDDPNYG